LLKEESLSRYFLNAKGYKEPLVSEQVKGRAIEGGLGPLI